MAALSSLMTIAGSGLYPNPPSDVGVAIGFPANTLTTYQSIPFVSTVDGVVESAQLAAAGGSISAGTLQALVSVASSNFPALTDTTTSGNAFANLAVPGVGANNFSIGSTISFNANEIFGNGDLSKFCQVFMASIGYASQVNETLTSLQGAATLATTFNPLNGGMDSISTGGLNQVTSRLDLMATDLERLGQAINLSFLNDLGLPGELLAQISRVTNGGLASVTELLQAAGLADSKIDNLSRGTNTLTAAEELVAYNVCAAVSGETLTQVLAVLGVTTTNITNLSQLLNPRHLFPLSYVYLLCPTPDGLQSVYLGGPTVNSALNPVLADLGVSSYTGPNNTNSLEILRTIIPPDQALANKALARSLQQVKAITDTDLPALARAMSAVQPNTGLDLIQGLTTPLPSSVSDFVQSQLVAQGTGIGNTITLGDVIGVASGYIWQANLASVNSVISNLETNGSLTSITALYEQMQDTLDGVYGNATGNVDIPTGPAAGNYVGWNDAFTSGLIPAANAAVATIVATNGTEVSTANQAWGNIIASLGNENTNLTLAEIDFGNLQSNSKSAIMIFTSSLHEYGLDVSAGGANEVLVSVANTASLSGQALLGSLREGRNLAALQDVGVQLDTQLPSSPG